MKRQFLKPSLLGIVLMLCLLFVQATAMRGTGMSILPGPSGMPSEVHMHYSYGLPPMVRINTSGPSEDQQRVDEVQVRWGTIAAVLAAAWCVAMVIGRYVTGYTRRDGEFAGPRYTGVRHSAATVGYVLAGCAVVAVICGIVFQRIFGAGVMELSLAFVTLLTLLAVPATVIVMIVRRWRHRGRVVQRGFAVEPVAGRT